MGKLALAACDALAEARIAATHVESGFMKLDDGVDGQIDAWIATKLAPARWRELAAWTRWAAWNNGLAEVERPADSTLFVPRTSSGIRRNRRLSARKRGEWSQTAGKLFDLAESADAEPLSVTRGTRRLSRRAIEGQAGNDCRTSAALQR
ncbi:MAG: hypothetical protein R2845_00065 [Thermomicrobiales bacterium]